MEYVSTRLGCTVVGTVVLGVHSEDDPNDADWTAYLEAGRQVLASKGTLRVLAYSLGGGPNSTQRSAVNELFKDRPQRVAVMLNSRIARGAVTALSWFNNEIKPFNLEQLDEAGAHLQLSAADLAAVRAKIKSLSERMKELRG